ncbi:hypothetical protein LSAT2_030628 [Lamellibrachia satsuma]|nr:hypothetical protein LSAT2_030628 [Lamellibrachia satsuma]
MELDIDAILAEHFSQMNDQLDVKVSRAKEINKPHVSKATSSAAINLMAEHRISYRKRRSFKLDVIPTTFSASNVRRTPKTKSKKRQTTVISKTKRAASKAAVTLEKLAFLFLSLVPSIVSLFYMRTIAAHIVTVLSGGEQKLP